MRVIARASLRVFWERYPDSQAALEAWFWEATHANWRNSAEVKEKYRSASIVGGERMVFNVCGNKYRLIVRINFHAGVAFVKFVGTHAEYDSIDARTVEWKRKS